MSKFGKIRMSVILNFVELRKEDLSGDNATSRNSSMRVNDLTMRIEVILNR